MDLEGTLKTRQYLSRERSRLLTVQSRLIGIVHGRLMRGVRGIRHGSRKKGSINQLYSLKGRMGRDQVCYPLSVAVQVCLAFVFVLNQRKYTVV
jgi:hypothetical protein